MKIAFFSDIHGNHYAFDAFLKKAGKMDIDKFVFCGDVFGYYYGQEDILTKMNKMNNLICIKGNHDQMFLDIFNGKLDENIPAAKYGSSYKNVVNNISMDNALFVSKWPDHISLFYDNIHFGIYHGTPDDYLNGRIYPDTSSVNFKGISFDIIILGHTHHKMERKYDSKLIINPGSLGQQRDGKGCSFLVFDTAENDYQYYIIEYDIDKLINDIDKYDNGNKRFKEVLFRKN